MSTVLIFVTVVASQVAVPRRAMRNFLAPRFAYRHQARKCAGTRRFKSTRSRLLDQSTNDLRGISHSVECNPNRGTPGRLLEYWPQPSAFSHHAELCKPMINHEILHQQRRSAKNSDKNQGPNQSAGWRGVRIIPSATASSTNTRKCTAIHTPPRNSGKLSTITCRSA